MSTYHVAFVGNPNVGKSAWINALSDADFTIGNWPGVTVERKEATCNWNDDIYHLIDLPGCYSLLDNRNEEQITSTFLKEQQTDLIVNVLDATNLSRNLLLTLYLRELQIPMILIFNFMDEAKKQQIYFEFEKLCRRLQIPILPYSAFDSAHIGDVKEAIIKHVTTQPFYYPLYQNEEMEAYVNLYNLIKQHLPQQMEMRSQDIHRLCMDVLKENTSARKQLETWNITNAMRNKATQNMTYEKLEKQRFHCIATLMKYVKQDEKKRYAKSEKIDNIMLHKTFGMPIFFVIFTLLLLFVFQASAPWNDFIDFLIQDIFSRYVQAAIFWMPDVLQHLIIDGILSGVGGVLVFVPLMGFLYMILSLLEESGYMARIAFLLDCMMHHMHLSGKSFVALMLGFGCNVPAIYATRTLDDEKQKKLTALLVPFMSCGARLPVYVLFASAFFPHKAGLMLITIYAIGVFFALLLAFFYSRFSHFKEEHIFILELPPYRIPRLKIVWHKVVLEVKGYVRKACGIVMWAMIVLWSLSYFPNGDFQTSYIASFSKQIAPVFEPLGFGTRWESVASLPGGIIAKETIIGFFEQVEQKETIPFANINLSMDMKKIGNEFVSALHDSIFFLHQDVSLKPQSNEEVTQIRLLWNDEKASLRAFCFMVYVLLSIPCIMTLQALYHEYGWKLMMISIGSMLIVPYLVALFIFQLFSLFI